MELYRERLWPAWWIYAVIALVIPASLLILAPVSIEAGAITAAVFFIGLGVAITVTSPTIVVTEDALRVGNAHLERSFVSGASAHRTSEATAQRGVLLDARAWLCIRGWVDPVVRIELNDPEDPVPYWIVSSRTPEALVAALSGKS